MVRQCRVYRSFDVDSIFLCWQLRGLSLRDRLSLKPSTSSLSDIDVSREYAANVSSQLRAASMEDQTFRATWGHYKSALDFAAREVLGKRLCAKKP